MGAFLSYALPSGKRESMLGERDLIVDPGWRTFDWLVTQGRKVLDRRSDAVNKGMFDFVDTIACAVAKHTGAGLGHTDYDRIDEALRSGTKPRFLAC